MRREAPPFARSPRRKHDLGGAPLHPGKMEAIGVANLAQQPVRAPLREVNMAQDASDTAEVIAPPPAIYAGGLVLGLLVQRLWPLSPFPVRFARPLGLLLSLASL